MDYGLYSMFEQALHQQERFKLNDEVWVFGAGKFAFDVIDALEKKGIKVKGIITTRPLSSPVPFHHVLLEDFCDKDAQVLLGVFNHNINSCFSYLKHEACVNGINNLVMPMAFYPLLSDELGYRYWLSGADKYFSEIDNIESALAVFTEKASRDLFVSILKFRLGIELDMPVLHVDTPQYFLPEMADLWPAKVRWIDAGCYDGDTIQASIPHFKTDIVFAFEPDVFNLENIKLNVSGLNLQAINIPLGLWGCKAKLGFNSGAGSASAISGLSDDFLSVSDLDSLVLSGGIDFIKMDIEGAEVPALSGAKKIIAREQPMLAIAAYHHWDDIWQVPLEISRQSQRDNLALRTHCFNTFDTVCYSW